VRGLIQDVYGLIQDIYGLIQDIHGLIQDTHGLIQDIHGSSHGPLQTGTPKQASNMINDSVITYAQIAPDRADQHGVLRSGFQMSAFKKQRLCPYVDAARGAVTYEIANMTWAQLFSSMFSVWVDWGPLLS
jgi:hypothetical protein